LTSTTPEPFNGSTASNPLRPGKAPSAAPGRVSKADNSAAAANAPKQPYLASDLISIPSKTETGCGYRKLRAIPRGRAVLRASAERLDETVRPFAETERDIEADSFWPIGSRGELEPVAAALAGELLHGLHERCADSLSSVIGADDKRVEAAIRARSVNQLEDVERGQADHLAAAFGDKDAAVRRREQSFQPGADIIRPQGISQIRE
jgi:hypothetical protein